MPAGKPYVRIGDHPGDRIQIVHMAARFQSVANYPVQGDAGYFSMVVNNFQVADEGCVFVIDVHELGLAGFILGEIRKSHLLPGKFASEVMLWIEPEYRGRWFRPLIKAYEEWARSNGAVGAFLSSQDKRTSRVYDRLGYGEIQTHHLKVF